MEHMNATHRPPTTTPRMAVLLMREVASAERVMLISSGTAALEYARLHALIIRDRGGK